MMVKITNDDEGNRRIKEFSLSWVLQPGGVGTKKHSELPVSCLAYKELGDLHSHLHMKKKAKQTKNKHFVDLRENWGHRTNYCLSNLRNKQTEDHNLSKQKIRNINLW